MIKEITIMLYVTNVKATATFWQTYLEFEVIQELEIEGYPSIVLSTGQGFNLQLFASDFIQKFSPEVSLAPPSLLLTTEDIHGIHGKMATSDYFVSELSQRGDKLVFNFADNENRYFAVTSL